LNEANRIILLKSGDSVAFRKLVDQYRDQLFNIVLGLLQSHDDADDVIQEVFLEVFQSIRHFRGSSKLSTWMYRIAVQKSLEYIRTSKRKKRAGVVLSLFGYEHRIPVATSSPFYHPGIKLENKERASILFGAIRELPVSQRTAFTLHKVEALSYAEIAEIMKVSVSSVESLIFRAKQNLQKSLADYYEKNER